ncbi:hypothetical protein ACFVR2_23435 [Gottfriedia sp. NPDC057991]|uniref:hypothetical protein n=1 Tax=Gottfriedia sp. NPDC057991 TaxID=3346298 RepID=UPI0036D9700D
MHKIKRVFTYLLSVTLLASSFSGLTFSTKTFAETSQENTSVAEQKQILPAPPIIQGRAVNEKYPQMSIPTVEAFSNGNETGKGYFNVSWEPVDGVTKYQVILFNGSIHSYWNVPADQTSWTTKDKGMFPTEGQIEVGQVDFRRDGKGTEFSIDPSSLFKKAYEKNVGLNYSDSNEYYVRVTAVHEDGARPISYATTASIKLEQPEVKAYSYNDGNDTGYIDVKWNSVLDVIGYKVAIYNGDNYQYIDVGNVTTWTSKEKGIWPISEEIEKGNYLLHLDETGSEIDMDPTSVYTNAYNATNGANGDNRESRNLKVGIIAIYKNVESPISDIATSTIPIDAISLENLSQDLSNVTPVGLLTSSEVNMINNNAPIEAESRNVVTAMAKKLATKALRYSATWLEGKLAKKIGTKNAKKVSKSFYKIADYIDKVTNAEEKAITTILIQGGVAPDVAASTARWIVLFFGI